MKNMKRLMVTLLALAFCAGMVACGDDLEDSAEDACYQLADCDYVDEEDCEADGDGDGEGEDISDECEDAMIAYNECIAGSSCEDIDDHYDFETEDSPCDSEQDDVADAC